MVLKKCLVLLTGQLLAITNKHQTSLNPRLLRVWRAASGGQLQDWLNAIHPTEGHQLLVWQHWCGLSDIFVVVSTCAYLAKLRDSFIEVGKFIQQKRDQGFESGQLPWVVGWQVDEPSLSNNKGIEQTPNGI